MTTSLRTTTADLRVDRKALVAALTRIATLAPATSCKPVLGGVQLSSSTAGLTIAATDSEHWALQTIEAEGSLLPCLVPCATLLARVRTLREPTLTLRNSAAPERLAILGGAMQHALETLPLADYPPIPADPPGMAVVRMGRPALHAALAAASCGVARETSRYALDAVLLESDDDGVRLVATDGRRLVTANLVGTRGAFRGQALLPGRLARLALKFMQTGTAEIDLAAELKTQSPDTPPSVTRVGLSGPGWQLSGPPAEGKFPLYRDVIPASASRFVVDRVLFLNTLRDMSAASPPDARSVRVTLRRRSLELSAGGAGQGSAAARIPARFIAGRDALIHTGFSPAYLLDAARTIPGERLILDVAQNGCGIDGTVFGKPALLYGADRLDEGFAGRPVGWVIMPLSFGFRATREYLGSNFRPEAAHAA